MSEKVQAVEAEVIDDAVELSLIDEGLVSVNFEGLMGRLKAINDAIAKAKRAEAELAVSDEALAEMPLEDAKRFEQSINGAIKEAEAAHKAFNGDYDTPKKAVAVAYGSAMDSVTDLHSRYKGRRVQAENEIKQHRYSAMEEAYLGFMEGNGLGELAAAVPFERIAEDKWWNTVAKKWSEKGTEALVVKRATEIVADWNSVKATPYHYPEQAQATFFCTLSLREVNEQDAAMWEDEQRVAAVNAELEANRAYCEPEEYAPECEPVPDIVAQAEQVVAQVEQPATWVLCVDLTPSQYEAMIAWFKVNGVHGKPMRTSFPGYERAAQMVKAVCNG